MKKMYIIIILFVIFICGLSIYRANSTTLIDNTTLEHQPINPETNVTFEKQVNATNNLLSATQDSYKTMLSLSESTSASKKGTRAANKVTQTYASRIDELAKIDFFALSSEELDAISFELSDIITAIREARDLLDP